MMFLFFSVSKRSDKFLHRYMTINILIVREIAHWNILILINVVF